MVLDEPDLSVEHEFWPLKIAFSPDGEVLASVDENGSLRLWSIPSGSLIREFSSIRVGVGPVGLYAYEDDAWPADKPVLTFHPAGTSLTILDDQGRAIRLDWETGEIITQSFMPYQEVLALSPDGQFMASGGYFAVELWNANTGESFAVPIRLEVGLVSSLAFSNDGMVLAVGNISGRPPHLLSLDWVDWIERACNMVGRNLSAGEWEAYLGPDVGYRRTCPQWPSGAGAPPDAPVSAVR
jgi:WD40 repeat protein